MEEEKRQPRKITENKKNCIMKRGRKNRKRKGEILKEGMCFISSLRHTGRRRVDTVSVGAL